MDELFDSPISYIIVILFLIAFVLLVIALQQLQRGRSNIYWRQRRAAGQRGGQLFLVAVTLFGITLVMAFFSGFAAIMIDNIFNDDSTPQETQSVSSEITPELLNINLEATIQSAVESTLTAQPTRDQQNNLTPAPENEIIQPTANPFLVFQAIPSPQADTIALPENSSIQITALSAEITDQFTAEVPQDEFLTGTKRLYIFMEFSGIPDDILWTRTLLHEGNVIYSRTEAWTMPEIGNQYIFIDADFPAGVYELIITSGDIVMDSYEFTFVKESLFEQSSN